MPGPFYTRLAAHFTELGRTLRGQAGASAIFSNSSDIGIAREQGYVDFLRKYAPSNCNVDLGGFVFDVEGNESKQVDVIITAANVPRFKPDGVKAFSCVVGTVGVVCVKSHLDKKELFDALDNLASVPIRRSMKFPSSLRVNAAMLADIPLRVLYASSGISTDSLRLHMKSWVNDVHASRPGAIIQQLPHIVHVAGQCVMRREPASPGADGQTRSSPDFVVDESKSADAVALGSVVQYLHNFTVVAHVALPEFEAVYENMYAAC